MTRVARARIAVDATPLLGAVTGVGHYTDRLLRGLATTPGVPHLVATAVSARGAGLAARVPPGVDVRRRPVPAGLLHRLWADSELVPAEWLSGRVDLFHGTNFVLPPLRRAAGVVTVHDLSFLRWPQHANAGARRYRELVPRSIRRAAAVCTLTAAMRDEIVAEYRLGGRPVHVTSPGVDEEWFAAAPLPPASRATLGVPDEYVLAVGTLEPRKNLRALVRAHHRLRGEDADVPPLVLAGPPGWGPELAATPDVRFTGYLPAATLRSLVAGASLLAFPSHYEGFGLPPVEALACGVPVLSNDLPVTREVLGDQAQFVAADDVDALAEGVRAALEAPRDDAARAARRARAARWTWSECVRRTLTAYQEVLG